LTPTIDNVIAGPATAPGHNPTRSGRVSAVQIISDLGGPGGVPRRRKDTALVASVDVEWTKNYKIKDGNQAFCYSVVWLEVPSRRPAAILSAASRWWSTSVYVDSDLDRAALIEMAATDIGTAAAHADFVVGHQLSSDLAVLSSNVRTAGRPVPAELTQARTAWRERRAHDTPSILDTRYDAGHLLTGGSRRLVDVCAELGLDVTQPELARQSMTALHRRWLHDANVEARERITVLNLRHALSTALVAVRAAGRGSWTDPINVNAMLTMRLPKDRLGWLASPTFQSLVGRGP
jgi:hypothetical protein